MNRKLLEEKLTKFIEDEAERKSVIDELMDANGKSIEELKEQIASKDKEIETLNNNIAERNKDIETLKKAEDKVSKEDFEKLQSKYDELEKSSKEDIANVKKGFMIDKEIASSNPRNAEIVKKQIDLDKVTFDGEKITGLSEQLEALKKDADYLFNAEEKKEDTKEVTTGQSHNEEDDTDDALINRVMGLETEK